MNVTLMRISKSVAMAGTEFEYDYAEVFRRVKKAKDALPHNCPKVAIFADNCPEWTFSLYGAWLNGSTVIPIDARSSVAEISFILGDSTPQALCTSRANLDAAKAACATVASPPDIIIMEDLFAGELPARDVCAPPVERDENCLALIVYTSGTTGNPKGVMLTFANMHANMKAVYEAKYFTDGVRVLTMLPFHHILPLMGTLVMPLSVGGKLVFPKSISPADIGEVLQKHHVDMIVSVPRFYEMLHANIMAKINSSKVAKALFDFAKIANCNFISKKLFGAVHRKFGGEVKFWVSGGAALDKKIWRDLDVLGFEMREGYGMTECAPIISFPRIGRNRLGSPGEPLPGIEVRIVEGEIAVRGRNVTSGYLNRPEETAEAIRNGWLYTGDLGYIDEDGFIFITGRRKEIIVLPNGKNLNPAEMEAQIKRQSSDIVEVGVLMYDNLLQAVVRVDPALIEKLGRDGAEEHIRNTAILPYNRATATYKRIIKFALISEDLPRTRVGKLKRHLLAAYIENRDASEKPSQPAPQTQIYAELRDVIAAQVSVPVRPDAHMEMDLGLDSLGKISVQCFVRENYGVEVAERDFEKFPSLREFAEMVEKNRDESFDMTPKNVTWGDIIKTEPYPEIRPPNFFHFVSIVFFRAFAGLFYRLTFEGAENVKDDRPMIIAPNHQSYLDALYVAMPFTKTQIYKTYFFAKVRSIIKSGLIKAYAERSNVIVMDINDNVSAAVRKLAAALRKGNRIIVFPEGTRTKDGAVAEFKQSFAILAKEMNVPVVPAAITGAYAAVKAGSTLPTFGAKIRVKYLPEMSARPEESYEEFSARVRAAVEDACKKA